MRSAQFRTLKRKSHFHSDSVQIARREFGLQCKKMAVMRVSSHVIAACAAGDIKDMCDATHGVKCCTLRFVD